MAPTAEITETQVPTDEAVFMARRRSLTLVRKPERVKYADSSGEKITVPGVRYTFQNGRLATADPDVIEWLRGHELYGNSESGFFEVKQTVPEPVDELRRIALAGASGDADAIAVVLEEERAGWNRELVVESCEFALVSLAEAASAVKSVQPPAGV